MKVQHSNRLNAIADSIEPEKVMEIGHAVYDPDDDSQSLLDQGIQIGFKLRQVIDRRIRRRNNDITVYAVSPEGWEDIVYFVGDEDEILEKLDELTK